MKRDSIDFGTMSIPQLFGRMLVPTLLGMVLSATINIADGIFVGRGAGSDALAAVNIVAPFFMVTTGIGLMFGTGASIVSSIHLSHGKLKAACINVTQAFVVSVSIMAAVSAAVMTWPDETAHLLGASEHLLPYVREYMLYIVPAFAFAVVMSIGLFVIRLDGSPRFAMLCNATPALLNVVLDWLFIFLMQMGIGGAALATALTEVVGCLMVLVYMLRLSRVLRFRRIKLSAKSLRLTLRNTGYMVRLGASSFIGELAIACIMLTGNYVFISRLGDDGVAAFSAACYCLPIAFMVSNAIAQSAQPIISYNHGAGRTDRVRQTFRMAMGVTLLYGIAAVTAGIFLSDAIVGLFLSDGPAAAIARNGFPQFAAAFPFFAFNVVCIGYYQSLERFKAATAFMLLRGFVFIVPCFLALPGLLGTSGLWLAVPLSELLTLATITSWSLIAARNKGRRH